MTQHWKLETDAAGIAWLCFDKADAKANVLASYVIEELNGLLDQLEEQPPKGLVLYSGKPGSFIMGADITEFSDFGSAEEVARLSEETPDSMMLAECLGPSLCQRDFRGLTCRQFPFFPYIDSQGNLLGLSYYWEYEEQCWVVSNLAVVTEDYKQQFLAAFEYIFEHVPGELENYHYHSEVMRDAFNEQRRAIRDRR